VYPSLYNHSAAVATITTIAAVQILFRTSALQVQKEITVSVDSATRPFGC
jgi:hypothetical protein